MAWAAQTKRRVRLLPEDSRIFLARLRPHCAVIRRHFSASGTALAAGVLLLFLEQLPVDNPIPLTQTTIFDQWSGDS
jgi:hypothetical protein